jgi:hypothetical protein
MFGRKNTGIGIRKKREKSERRERRRERGRKVGGNRTKRNYTVNGINENRN